MILNIFQYELVYTFNENDRTWQYLDVRLSHVLRVAYFRRIVGHEYGQVCAHLCRHIPVYCSTSPFGTIEWCLRVHTSHGMYHVVQ
jgi:hypothetical protein